MAYQLPELNFASNALEPHIDARTMEIHHGKHHNAYVTNLNNALSSAGYEAPECVWELLGKLNDVPESIRVAVRNNGGGHANHSLFWDILTPGGSSAPEGALKEAIDKDFGSLDEFKAVFAKAGATRFGSGWAWLGINGEGKLCVCSTPNQDNPIMPGGCGCKPILGLDVWEHAYYLNYQNRRPDYIAAFWNVVNWTKVGEYYDYLSSCDCGK